LPNFNQIWISWQIFIELTNIKTQSNPSSGSHAHTCRKTDIYRQDEAKRYYQTFYSPMNAQVIVLKTILKFTLK